MNFHCPYSVGICPYVGVKRRTPCSFKHIFVSRALGYGKNLCDCKGSCSCSRKFSDPSARWGWDSYHEQWFFGYIAYLLSIHNPVLKLDLPIYMKFVEAARNDGVTLITTLAHARYLYKDFITFDSLLADAAHDIYPTYDLLKQWNIKPFIDLNKRRSDEVKLQNISLSKCGTPICPDGHLNRLLTDYELEQPKRYGKKKLAIFAFLNAINVHLDAQVKFGEVSVDSLIV